MIARTIYSSVIILTFFIFVILGRTRCEHDAEIEDMTETLDAMLTELKMERYSRETNDLLKIWQEYEFGTGAGNREELIVTNISIEAEETFSSGIKNWQYAERSRGDGVLAGSGDNGQTLWVYLLGNQDGRLRRRVVLTATGTILTFKIISLVNSSVNYEEIIIVLSVETGSETKLAWYKLVDDKFEPISSLVVSKRVQRLEFFRIDEQTKLVLLNEPVNYLGSVYSSIDVYGFKLVGDLLDLWLCQKIWVPEATSFEICSVYEDTILAVQSGNGALIYQYYESKTEEGLFKVLQNITSNGLKNMICFENGYTEYLMITGPDPSVFIFQENEFLYDSNLEKLFNDVGEILWARCVPVRTYREECLLLMQLKNFTVIGLTWQGQYFQIIDLPEIPLINFDLTKIVAVGDYGFAFEDKLVKIETKLRDLPRPVYDEMEKILQLKNSLEEIFLIQEGIIDETEVRIETSYFKNPVITGSWHVSRIDTQILTISDQVSYQSLYISSKPSSLTELMSDLTSFDEPFGEFDRKLQILESVADITIRSDSQKVVLSHEFALNGSLEVRGTLHVKNLTLRSLNGIPIETITNDLVNYGRDKLIKGRKTFSSIEADTLNIEKINGLPIENIIVDVKSNVYDGINFAILDQLVVAGNLSLTAINGQRWNDLMKSFVWKNRPTIIPGTTIIEGEISADSVSLLSLNGLNYPVDYVMQNTTDSSKISGSKTFDDLKVLKFNGVKTINGIPFEDFVTLNEPRVLPNEITFKNLTIENGLQIDRLVTGINVDQKRHRLTLQDINVVTADTVFANLRVKGNIIVENAINGKTVRDFDDIIRKNETIAVIRGEKRFLGSVRIEDKLKVTSKKYNGHAFDDFATLNSEQQFPNLKRISAPVTFGELRYKQLNDLEKYLENLSTDRTSACSEKKLIFKVDPLFEDLSFRTVNNEIEAEEFSKKFNEAFRDLSFDHLEVETLRASRVDPETLNGVNFTDFLNRRVSISQPQILTGNITIDRLEIEELRTEFLNDVSIEELEKFRSDFKELYDRIRSGDMITDTFVVSGELEAKMINGQPLSEIYARKEYKNVIAVNDFYAKNLQVRGYVNGINFTEFVSDIVLKTDDDVIFEGKKIIDTVRCDSIDFPKLNGLRVEDIVNPNVEQILSGPVLVNGIVKVKNSFDSDGKINDVVYKNLVDRISHRDNNNLELHGHFRFVNDARIENLHIDGPIQGITFDSFLDTIILQGDDVDISGEKTFVNSVEFRQNLTIVNGYNGLDLSSFNEKAVLIDRDVHIGSEVVFHEDINLRANLIVDKHLNAKTISHVEIDELETSAVFIDKPSFISGTLKFTNASFASSVTVDYLNDIDLKTVISLHDKQIILNRMSGSSLSADNVLIAGTINDYDPKEIFANTLTLSGDQIVTGNLTFHGNVRVAGNFYAASINGMRKSQFISLDGDENLNGSFQFENGLALRKDLHLDGLINGIDVATWETEAVYDNFPKEQKISADWYIGGNVRFENDVFGNGFLNGLDVRKLSDEFKKQNWAVEAKAAGVETDLRSTCDDLTFLQRYAKHQIYKFKYFDYLQILKFDVPVESLHNFEADGSDYLLINLKECFLNVAVNNGRNFDIILSEPDFDDVKKWVTLRYESQIYLVTIGDGKCGKSHGNLWQFERQKLTHILDLGNISDVKKTDESAFLLVSEGKLEKWFVRDVHLRSYGNFTPGLTVGNNARFVPNTRRILLRDENFIHELNPENLSSTKLRNYLGNGTIIGLRAGVSKTENFVYYDETLSENNAFIFNGLIDRRMRQSIPTHKAKSFLPLNFDGDIETFLTFVQNGRSLEIFEYKGVEGFVYRESIKMQIDRTFGFKLRKKAGLSRTNCIGILRGNILTILEAKMYGEKLDLEDLDCQN